MMECVRRGVWWALGAMAGVELLLLTVGAVVWLMGGGYYF